MLNNGELAGIVSVFVILLVFIHFVLDNRTPVDTRKGDWETVHGTEHSQGSGGGALEREVAYMQRTVHHRYTLDGGWVRAPDEKRNTTYPKGPRWRRVPSPGPYAHTYIQPH